MSGAVISMIGIFGSVINLWDHCTLCGPWLTEIFCSAGLASDTQFVQKKCGCGDKPAVLVIRQFLSVLEFPFDFPSPFIFPYIVRAKPLGGGGH